MALKKCTRAIFRPAFGMDLVSLTVPHRPPSPSGTQATGREARGVAMALRTTVRGECRYREARSPAGSSRRLFLVPLDPWSFVLSWSWAACLYGTSLRLCFVLPLGAPPGMLPFSALLCSPVTACLPEAPASRASRRHILSPLSHFLFP